MKLIELVTGEDGKGVAPFTGAWIETTAGTCSLTTSEVAPFTGAWIETLMDIIHGRFISRRPLHGGVD